MRPVKRFYVNQVKDFLEEYISFQTELFSEKEFFNEITGIYHFSGQLFPELQAEFFYTIVTETYRNGSSYETVSIQPFSDGTHLSVYGQTLFLLAFLVQEGDLLVPKPSGNYKQAEKPVSIYNCDIDTWEEYIKQKYPDVFIPPFTDASGESLLDLEDFLKESSIFPCGGLAIVND
jgi:hypothetical protein